MKTMLCHREEEVVAAVIRGNCDGSLSAHLASCESCRAAANMILLLRRDRACEPEDASDICSRNSIWTRAVLKTRERRKRIQRLGLAMGIILGILAGYLTSMVVLPANTKVSFERTGFLLSHSQVLVWPMVVVLAAVLLVLYADHAQNPMSGNH
jgi:hypothetical protein